MQDWDGELQLRVAIACNASGSTLVLLGFNLLPLISFPSFRFVATVGVRLLRRSTKSLVPVCFYAMHAERANNTRYTDTLAS